MRRHIRRSTIQAGLESRRVSNSGLVATFALIELAKFLRSVLRSGEILMQTRATLRNALRKRNYELPGVSNDMQSNETLRNSLGSN